MNSLQKLAAATFLGVSALVPAMCQAGLVGSTVSLTPIFASGAVQPTLHAVVSASTMEFALIPNYATLTLDITDSQLIFGVNVNSVFPAGVFNGFQILFSDVTLTNVALDAASTMIPFAVDLTGNRVDVNFQSSTAQVNHQTIIDVDTAATAVPEPATLALVGLALTGLGLARRSARPLARA